MEYTKEELIEKITYYADAYYSGKEIISDKEYDALIEQLRVLDPENELIAGMAGDEDEDEANAAGYKKVDHILTTGTLSKCMTVEAFKEWSDKHPVQYHVSAKEDGCLAYETLLETDKGVLPIGKIVEEKIKCNVKAKNLETGEVIFTPIKNYFINENDFDWYELETDDGKKIKVTGNHKVYLPKLRCWRRVEDLEIGDEFDITNYPVK